MHKNSNVTGFKETDLLNKVVLTLSYTNFHLIQVPFFLNAIAQT